MTNPTHASIRGDIYEDDLRIIGRRLRDNEDKPREPLYWEILGSSRNLYILRDPFGDLWEFDSADLDFHHTDKPVRLTKEEHLRIEMEHKDHCVTCQTSYSWQMCNTLREELGL